jgi:long-chain acyl-CoA synthetase
MENLHDHLLSLATKDPERPILLACTETGQVETTVTARNLLQKVESAAVFLQTQGLDRGDRVALDLGNSVEFLYLSWAAWATGIVTVPLDTKRDTEELRAFKISSTNAKLVLSKQTIPSASADTVKWISGLTHDALILFTSGTTARPKGALLTLENLAVNAEGIISWLSISDTDRFLVELPLHHINSTTFCLATLMAGASIAIPPRYSNSHFFDHAACTGATFTSIVPSIVFDQLQNRREFEKVKNNIKLNRIQIGSAPVVASAAEEFVDIFGIRLYQGYGQTETALRVTGVPMDVSNAEYRELLKENSIGTPMRWATVKVADSEGKILGEGIEGEIIVKGPAVMKEYVGGEPAYRDGYFLTGDIGFWKNRKGRQFFYLVGRSKEIIIKGGINISPVAVENALKRASTDIDQAYVVGVPDARYGEEIGAIIIWKASVIDKPTTLRRLKLLLLLGHIALSEYERPLYLAQMEAKQLPTTSTGKVQRTVLRSEASGIFTPIHDLLESEVHRFSVITPHSPLFGASHALYNHCWQPLTQTISEYIAYLARYITLGAVDADGMLVGQISFASTHDEFVCVSICSATFAPKSVPQGISAPSKAFVTNYLNAGHDPVMNFHTKLGAHLVDVFENGRPDDKSSLGYTMLLAYPDYPLPSFSGPVSHELIQAVRTLAHDMDAKVTAISRPGGLARYIAAREAA